MMRLCTVCLWVAFVSSSTLLAQSDDEGSATIAIDPETVLSALASAYRDHPTVDRVTVSVTSDGRTRADQLIVAIAPPDEVVIDMGATTAWVSHGVLRVVHSRDLKSYYEASSATSVIAALGAGLPPLPLPQIVLAFDPREPAQLDLTPYSRGVRWERAQIEPEAEPPVARVFGSAGRTAIEVVVDAASDRLLQVNLSIDQGATEITLVVTPMPARAIDALRPTLGRRKPTRFVSELRPRLADIVVGMELPELALPGVDLDTPIAPIKPPGAVLLFREWNVAVASALAALRRVRDGRDGFGLWSAMVIEPTDPTIQFRWTDATDWLDPDTAYYTISPATTIDRFAQGAQALAVVVDASGIVRDIIVLDQFAPAPPHAPDGNIQTAKPDPALVDQLADRIVRALTPSDEQPPADR